MENILGKGEGTISQPIVNKLVTGTENLRGKVPIPSKLQILALGRHHCVPEGQKREIPEGQHLWSSLCRSANSGQGVEASASVLCLQTALRPDLMPTAQSEGAVCVHPETQRLVLPCNVWGTYWPEVYPRQEVRPQTCISYTRGQVGCLHRESLPFCLES